MRSKNNAIQLLWGSISASVTGPSAEQLTDGLEFDSSGRGQSVLPKPFAVQPASSAVTIAVAYSRPVTISSIVLIERK